MRKMVDENGHILAVVRWLMTKNMWEYYITDEVDAEDKDVVFAYVCGFENEAGYVYLPEIAPYITSSTTDLMALAPAPGWRWLDECEVGT